MTSAPPPPPPPSTASPPRRTRLVLVAFLAAGALVVGGGVGLAVGLLTRGSSTTTQPPATAANPATVQARAAYRQALAAAAASPGFHYVAVSSGDSSNQKIVGDAGQSSGSQLITASSTFGQERFTLLLLAGVVYFQGNGPALQDQLGVPATSASGMVDKWISVASGDGPYGIVAPGITVADQVQETVLVPTSTQSLSGGGVRVLGTVASAQGGNGGTGHLDVAAGSHLPTTYVASTTVNGTTVSSTATFSSWGSTPTVTAPASAVAWSTLGASQPPGGYGSGGASSSQTPQA